MIFLRYISWHDLLCLVATLKLDNSHCFQPHLLSNCFLCFALAPTLFLRNPRLSWLYKPWPLTFDPRPPDLRTKVKVFSQLELQLPFRCVIWPLASADTVDASQSQQCEPKLTDESVLPVSLPVVSHTHTIVINITPTVACHGILHYITASLVSLRACHCHESPNSHQTVTKVCMPSAP